MLHNIKLPLVQGEHHRFTDLWEERADCVISCGQTDKLLLAKNPSQTHSVGHAANGVHIKTGNGSKEKVEGTKGKILF